MPQTPRTADGRDDGLSLDRFDFVLPEALIALRPAQPRDAARMLVVNATSAGSISDAHVRHLPDYLNAGDVLVVNDTQVIHARLRGQRTRAGSVVNVELLLHKPSAEPGVWHAFAKPARRLAAGDIVEVSPALRAHVRGRDGGDVEVELEATGMSLDEAIAQTGEMPLPPYIEGKRKADAQDERDYQTVFARAQGSVAAPTAGLHFTPALLEALENKGITRQTVTLHVGAGTFLPVKSDTLDGHRMHSEWGEVTLETAAALNAARAAGGRIVAVGTTSMRLLESAVDVDGVFHPFTDETDIFIKPGHTFNAVDVLMTNFHLPRSTLFVLVSAFAGQDTMHAAYAHAIKETYRFYSYGDASLLFRAACTDESA